MTKANKVKQWLLAGKSITQKEAISEFNAYRLSAIIFKLRASGMKIQTTTIPNGEGGNFASYKLEEA